ncbi:MAG TPA: tRNA (guanosine(37)-N1)-methyltransferase TrmD [Actinobacteria bacterium]|nr:tRNA (guanosine(37)-N1)-methyltransferase TrmD [Actinomycetota bacterium]
MIVDVVTIFPQLIKNFADYGVIKEAFSKEIIRLNIHNLRDFSKDRHRKVDDKPYGGGFGMVMMVQPFFDAVRFIKKENKGVKSEKQKTILFTPRGKVLNQKMIKELSGMENIIMLCGRYEGVDERVSELVVDLEISAGDYVLTGGEIPAMILIDGIARLLPGVINSIESLDVESFEKNLLEYPQYTRPSVFRNRRVPEILLSGNHAEIEKWRKEKSEKITRERRPDLFDKSF